MICFERWEYACYWRAFRFMIPWFLFLGGKLEETGSGCRLILV